MLLVAARHQDIVPPYFPAPPPPPNTHMWADIIVFSCSHILFIIYVHHHAVEVVLCWSRCVVWPRDGKPPSAPSSPASAWAVRRACVLHANQRFFPACLCAIAHTRARRSRPRRARRARSLHRRPAATSRTCKILIFCTLNTRRW